MVLPTVLERFVTVGTAAAAAPAGSRVPDAVVDGYLEHLFGNVYFIVAALLLAVGLLALLARQPDLLRLFDSEGYGGDAALLREAERELDEDATPKQQVPWWLIAWVLLGIPAVVAVAYVVDPSGFQAFPKHLIEAFLTPRST